MHNRNPLARTIGLAILLTGIIMLQGCSDESSGPSSDANADFPYLTGQPAVSPTTVADPGTVSYTVLATGPLGLGRVTASLTPFANGTGFENQASVNLAETATDTWTGMGTIDSGVTPLFTGGDGYYLLIVLTVDPTNVDQTTTFYTRATSGTNYTYGNHDSAFTEVRNGTSVYSVARVTVQ